MILSIKKITGYLILISFIYVFTINARASASESLNSAAFGYFYNANEEKNLNYLEIVLPNAISNKLKKKFSFRTLNPARLSKVLKRNSLLLKKKYNDIELPKLSSNMNTKYFIFGDFFLMENGKIKVKIHIYNSKTLNLFTFTAYGELQTEIFKLVDRIALRLSKIMSPQKLYLAESMKRNTTVGVITNLSGSDLNEIYFSFLKEQFYVKTFQANDLKNNISDLYIQNFYQVYSPSASLVKVARNRDIKTFYTIWTDKETMDKVLELKKLYEKYASRFKEKQRKLFTSITSNPYYNTDYLLIIGFNDEHSSAWARCIRLQDKSLIYTQSNIRAKSIGEITQKIINTLLDKK